MPFHINSKVGSIGGVTFYLIDNKYPSKEGIVWSTNSSFHDEESRYAVFALWYLSSNGGDVSQLVMNSDNDFVLALIRKNREADFIGKTLMVIMRLKNTSNQSSSFLGVRATGKMLVSEPRIYDNLGAYFGVIMSIEK